MRRVGHWKGGAWGGWALTYIRGCYSCMDGRVGRGEEMGHEEGGARGGCGIERVGHGMRVCVL